MKKNKITAVLGPTNTGKTHLAIETMLSFETGMIGFPLRLLAREVYDRYTNWEMDSRLCGKILGSLRDYKHALEKGKNVLTQDSIYYDPHMLHSAFSNDLAAIEKRYKKYEHLLTFDFPDTSHLDTTKQLMEQYFLIQRDVVKLICSLRDSRYTIFIVYEPK